MRLQLEQGCLRRRLGGIEHGDGKGGLVAGSRVGRGLGSQVESQFGTDLLLSKLT